MEEQLQGKQIAYGALAFVLWLVTFALGLECIYISKEMFILIYTALGGSAVLAERYALALILILALVTLVFIISTAEYHRKHFGKPESWRLFARSLAVELSIIVLYYIIL